MRWTPLLLVVTFLSVVMTAISPASSPQTTPGTFWKLQRDSKGVWWFVSPDGTNEFLNTVTTIQPVQRGRSAPHYLSSDFDGDLDVWAKKTADRVKDAGFKASGAWSSPAVSRYLPYSKDLNLIKHAKIPITDSGWESQIDAAAREQCAPLREDANLIGYFLDNELDWEMGHGLAEHAEKYFEVTTRAVRKYDPHHLILGVRFNHRAPLSVLRAMAGRVDAQSVNVYTDTGWLWRNNVRELYTITDCPVIISEFSFWSSQNGSGNRSERAWWKGVATQDERADTYRRFVLGAADNSFIVETAFFQWSDEPPSGRTSDGEDINTGFVDVFDRPYPSMVNANRRVRKEVNAIHGGSNDRQTNAIWRDDPMRVH